MDHVLLYKVPLITRKQASYGTKIPPQWLVDTLTPNCVNPVIPPHTQSDSSFLYKYVPPHRNQSCFSPSRRQLQPEAFFFFFFFPLSNLYPAAPAVEEVEKGVERKGGGSSCCFPYLITLHPLSPCRPTCQTLFPGILNPEGSVWDGNTKGMPSVTVRSSLNNKHINLMSMTCHTSICTHMPAWGWIKCNYGQSEGESKGPGCRSIGNLWPKKQKNMLDSILVQIKSPVNSIWGYTHRHRWKRVATLQLSLIKVSKKCLVQPNSETKWCQ